MSHINTYIVSTCRDNIQNIAIVQSGNSRAAVNKFILHEYPSSLHCDIVKLPSQHVKGKLYNVLDTNGSFTVLAEKINITSDFIPITKITI